MNSTEALIVGILQALFAKNPTVEEVITLLESVWPAYQNAKAGQAFSITFPESIAGKAGVTALSWTPN